MSEFGMFISTVVIGVIWLAVGGFVIHAIEYAADHAGGWLIGLTPEEVNHAREWREQE